MFLLFLKDNKHDNEKLERGAFGKAIGFSKLACKAGLNPVFLKRGISPLHSDDGAFIIFLLLFPLPGNFCPCLPHANTILCPLNICHVCRWKVLFLLSPNDSFFFLNSYCVSSL